MTNSEKTFIVICGPTASGKTGLGVEIAREFGACIISADSRQIYRGMEIGTAQPSASQLREVKHYFVGSHDVRYTYTAGKFGRDALELSVDLFRGSPYVVVVGGSGLYINALCNGLDPVPETDESIRAGLEARLAEHGIGNLVGELERLDPVIWGEIDRCNPRRVIRALEVCLITGKPYSELRSGGRKRDFKVVKIGTSIPRETLYGRIDARVDDMISQGLVEEARRLLPYRNMNSLQTVGYREMFDFFDGSTDLGEAVESIKRNSRRYAKRQMTWFGKDGEIEWFDPEKTDEIIEYIRMNVI